MFTVVAIAASTLLYLVGGASYLAGKWSFTGLVERAVSAVLVLLNPVKDRHGRPIPGPGWAWPDGQGVEKFLRGREQRHIWASGGSVYRIWSGCTAEIVLTRPEHVRLFHSDSARHVKSRSSNGGWLFHLLLGHCLGLINGRPWKNMLLLVQPDFTFNAVRHKTADVTSRARDYVRRQVLPPGVAKLSVPAAQVVSRFPFFCTAEHLYGPLTGAERERLWSIGQKSLGLMGRVLSGGLFRYDFAKRFCSSAVREFDDFSSLWTMFNEEAYQSRKGTPSPSPPPIVALWQAQLDGRVAKEEVLHTLSEILFANLDVSTHVFSWLVALLAENPGAQQELRNEIRNAGQDMDQYLGDKKTFLSFCFLESLRLRPFTVFTIPECSPETKSLGGFAVPANTSVVVDTIAVNCNTDYWGADAQTFRPQRFEKLKSTDLRYNLFTFGLGTRKCLGQHLADVMAKAFVCHLLDQFELSVPEKDNAPRVTSEESARDSWVPLADILVHFRRLEHSL